MATWRIILESESLRPRAPTPAGGEEKWDDPEMEACWREMLALQRAEWSRVQALLDDGLAATRPGEN